VRDVEGYHTPSEEYLEAIYALREEGAQVIGARIAERLGRSAASVSEMLDRLEGEGLCHRVGRAVELTAAGERQAVVVVRRHRLAERLLVDVLGLEWHKAHLEAGRWEHVISDDVEAKLVALLGDPATCPHGNPIPGSANAVTRAERALAEADPGRHLVVRVAESLEPDLVATARLEALGVLPGRSVDVVTLEASAVVLDGPEGLVRLERELCRQVFVALAGGAEQTS